MKRTTLSIALLPAAVLLSACSAWGNRQAAVPEAQCHAARASAFLDRKADDVTLNEAMVHAGAVRREVVPYGAGSRRGDVDPQRLNVEVDPTGVIRRLRCG